MSCNAALCLQIGDKNTGASPASIHLVHMFEFSITDHASASVSYEPKVSIEGDSSAQNSGNVVKSVKTARGEERKPNDSNNAYRVIMWLLERDSAEARPDDVVASKEFVEKFRTLAM